MTTGRLVLTVALIGAALLALPLYIRWFSWIAGSCGAGTMLEFLMPRLG